MEWLHIFAYIVIAVSTLIYLFLRKRFSYWADRGVVHEKPVLFFGNLYGVGRLVPLRQPFRELYTKYKHQAPFGGFYLSMRRAVVPFDIELVKNILIKDFSYFAHRGNYYNEKDDPLSAHLFNLDGPKWRSMRAKLTPTFTSGKMKFMFPTLVDVAEKFVAVLGELLDAQKTELVGKDEEPELAVELKDLLGRFTTDIIGTCAFGLECNSLRDPDTQFRVMGKKVFKKRRQGPIVNAIMQAYPNFARKLGIKTTREDVNEFFLRVVKENVEYREREGIQRNDFMNLLIELKNRNDTEGLTIEEISAQAFVFFLAGFETSSSTMSFCLYELAVNQDIQNAVREEISEMFERHNDKFTYEGMQELKYLRQVLHETMRKHSIASVITRKTVVDYAVPNSKYTIEKGTVIIIPIDAIHNDPDIYPNPEVFDPTRFEPKEVEKRSTVAFLPFGEGPRNCIGLRFGEMQATVGLVMLLKHFRFSPSKQTKIPIEIDPKSFILSAKDGVVLKLEQL